MQLSWISALDFEKNAANDRFNSAKTMQRPVC